MKCVVVGLGAFGKPTALALARLGLEVIAIDIEMRPVEEVKDAVALAVRLDATDEHALDEQGVGEADVLVAAIGSNFEAQLLVVVYAKALGVKHVIARAGSALHARILKLIGADEVLSPEEEAATRLAQRLIVPNLRSYFELSEGFSVVEIDAPTQMIGKSVEAIGFLARFRLNLVGIRHPPTIPDRPGRFDPVPASDHEILKGEVLALVGSDLDLARLIDEHS